MVRPLISLELSGTNYPITRFLILEEHTTPNSIGL